MSTRPVDPPRVSLVPRDVRWDWSDLPIHYLGNQPMATHFANAFNMLLPEGEVFFVQTFQQALAHIIDEQVRDDVIGFIGQEAVHSTAHQSVLEHFASQGFDTAPYVDQVRWFFRGLLGDRDLDGAKKHSWLIERIAIVAALEHVTSYIGNWGLNAHSWDTEMDPRMLDLFRWHLAEEVEHRHVAFDLFTHLDGSYLRRIRAHIVAYPTFILLVLRAVRYLADADPHSPSGRIARLRGLRRAIKDGLILGPKDVFRMAIDYFRPSYHPSQYGSTSQAVAYLASSPAALEAIDRTGR
ncbi:metal-dependent hydrolase [Rhodococcus sp. 06-156-3C]|uniref:metal-dependent hydrolase n=1 Tax=Nocardiaceae TaxID=85025 RepID=UPI0005230C5B|nr:MULTISPECIES: metal-dependent hydrolase [Rhodococcus]OZD13045.1 metal-dependent hydrolase [Rhodococcus sp. 06-156-4a]OZD17914.1 metal-dependent hydrolase [Rhodococcus sp. 06-156-3C]OZD20638.1 metal-dependent hydrolase [Rhodococcus sp. 06-156-4C]OZD30644.1 metal-dependent hydrolase [Rhodococcus sp. 06-156-3b]OZD32584.1 metal-dependent hydrolase [Rhodococcus sp. 06-156-3]